MSILTSPPAVIFINNDLVPQIQDVFRRQLYLTDIIDKPTFDGYIAVDGYYVHKVHAMGQRIMVLGDLFDYVNRDLFDIVMFAKAGLVSVELNKLGPPNITLPIDRVYLTALINLQKARIELSISQAYYDQFGNIKNHDFDPHHLDYPLTPLPEDV